MNKTKSRGYIQALVLAIILTLSALTLANQHRRSIARDKQDMIDLENEWLHAHDRTSLERILASDFVHPVPTGDFLTKEQHIAWNVAHPPPAEIRYQFENLTIRIYGNTAIANGTVVKTKADGSEIARTVFTDVFVFRDNRWQAVNAQENSVHPRPGVSTNEPPAE